MSYEEIVTQAITSLIRATLQDPKAARAIVEKVSPKNKVRPAKIKVVSADKPLSASERQRRAAFKAWKTRRAAKKA